MAAADAAVAITQPTMAATPTPVRRVSRAAATPVAAAGRPCRTRRPARPLRTSAWSTTWAARHADRARTAVMTTVRATASPTATGTAAAAGRLGPGDGVRAR